MSTPQDWAYLCHATQFGPSHHWRRASTEALRAVFGKENFVLAWPEGEVGKRRVGLP